MRGSRKPDGDVGGWSDNLHLGNRFSRLLIYDVREAKFCDSRNLQHINLHDKLRGLSSLDIVIDLQQQTNRLCRKLHRTRGDKQRLDDIFVQNV